MKKILATTAGLFLSFLCFGQPLEPGLLGEYFYFGPYLREMPNLEPNQKPSLKRIDATIAFERSKQFPRVKFSNDFYARWTGRIRVERPGKYKFFLESDDGSQLFIYDRKVVDNGGLHAVVEKSGEVDLPAGDHPIHIDYFQGASDGACKLSWEGNGIEKQVIPAGSLWHEPIALPPAHEPGPGLIAEFFDMGWSLWDVPTFEEYEKPTVVRIDPVISYPDVESFLLAGLDKYFSSRWTGKINIPKDGAYTFILTSDDGSYLYLDGKQVIDHNGRHKFLEKKARIDLTAGLHQIKVEQYQNEGSAGCVLEWEGPDLKKEVVPATAFSH